MDSLDYRYYEPNQLDVQYPVEPIYEPTLETNTTTTEDLDQELEDLLLMMEGTSTYQSSIAVETNVDKVERLNPDQIKIREFNYQPTPTNRSKYDQVPTCSSSKFNYQTRDSSSRLNSDYSSTTGRFNYSPSGQNNCNYQAGHSRSKFDYQSDQDSSSKFSHVPTTNNDRFDYTPTKHKSFDRPSNSKNYSPIPHAQNNSGVSDHDQSILDVEVDQNTRVRLEVGVNAEVGNGYAHAAAYAKATIYRRG